MNASTPWHDSVVAEIHAVREHLADQFHDDLVAYTQAAEARCRTLGLTMAEDQRKTLPETGTAAARVRATHRP